jgi:dihydroflavonol-4-reductase
MGGKTLVTGGAGFIGTHLVEQLLGRGDEVRVLDLVPPPWPRTESEFVSGSVTDPEAVRRAMHGVSRVFHLAGKAGLWAADRTDHYGVNRDGTRNVLEAAEEAGVARLVHCSSEVTLKSRYGPERDAPIDEAVQPGEEAMCGDYCRAKWQAEQEALAAARRGLPVVVVNPAAPVGPGDRNLTPPSRMLLGYLNGRYPAYLDSALNLVDVRDVALGHIRADEVGRTGERYLLGNANLRLDELLRLLNELTGLPMPRRRIPYRLAYLASVIQELWADHVSGRPPSAPLSGLRLARTSLFLDNRKAREELGLAFRPLRDSLTDAIQWFECQGLLERRPVWRGRAGTGCSGTGPRPCPSREP